MLTSLEDGRLCDVILMDFEMPVLNGPATAKRLREFGCTIPIIGLTGNVLHEDVALFKASGADAVLNKPLTISELQANVAAFCSRSH